MLLSLEEWMDLRAFRALRAAGATWAEIARETGYDWRTVKKYLAAEAQALPPSVQRQPQGRMIDPWKPLIDGWLEGESRLQATVIHQRLVSAYGETCRDVNDESCRFTNGETCRTPAPSIR